MRATAESMQGSGRPVPLPLMLTIALLSAVAPFATDLYLSAFPDMVDELTASAATVQFTLTAFLIGVAAGQLVIGPLSDRLGRLGPLLAGTVLLVLASVAAALAPSVAVLIVARLLQGFGGAAGMVIGRAIVADLVHGPAAARAMSVTMLVGGVAPIIAPFAGSLLAEPLGWRGLLWIVAALAVCCLLAVLGVVRETRPRALRVVAADAPSGFAAVRPFLGRAYLGGALGFAFAFATMMAYISASPFLYQTMMGFGAVAYGVAFGVNALVLMAVSFVSVRLTYRFRLIGLARVGVGIGLAGILAFGILVVSGAPALSLAFVLPVIVGSVGLVMGNASALAMGAIPGSPGAASAFLGCLQFVLAGVVAPIVGIGGEATALPLAATMLVASLLANAMLWLVWRPRPDPAAASEAVPAPQPA